MVPLTMMAIGMGVSALSGLVGYLVESGREAEAEAIMERARGLYDNITPAQLNDIAAEVLGPSEFSKIRVDPRYEQAQNEALAKMEEMEEGGGFTLEDTANLNRVQNQLARNEMASRQAILENMRSRGVAGSGAELAMELSASQANADRAQQAGLDVAAQAQRRYFDAIRGRGDFASQMRSQAWNEQAAAASAQDAINRFNMGHRFDVARYNNDMAQQRYNNEMALRDRRYGMERDRADAKRQSGQRQSETIGGVGGAVGGGFMRGAGYEYEDRWNRNRYGGGN